MPSEVDGSIREEIEDIYYQRTGRVMMPDRVYAILRRQPQFDCLVKANKLRALALNAIAIEQSMRSRKGTRCYRKPSAIWRHRYILKCLLASCIDQYFRKAGFKLGEDSVDLYLHTDDIFNSSVDLQAVMDSYNSSAEKNGYNRINTLESFRRICLRAIGDKEAFSSSTLLSNFDSKLLGRVVMPSTDPINGKPAYRRQQKESEDFLLVNCVNIFMHFRNLKKMHMDAWEDFADWYNKTHGTSYDWYSLRLRYYQKKKWAKGYDAGAHLGETICTGIRFRSRNNEEYIRSLQEFPEKLKKSFESMSDD